MQGFNFAVHEVKDVGELILRNNQRLNSLISLLSPSSSILPDGTPAIVEFDEVSRNKRLWLLFLPTCGGLLVSALHKFSGGWSITAPNNNADTSSENNQLGLQSFLKREFYKTTAAVLTLGTGCSLGPGGPSVEIGTTVSQEHLLNRRHIADIYRFLCSLLHPSVVPYHLTHVFRDMH